MLKCLGLYEDVSYRFSKWDPNNTEKYIGTKEQWGRVINEPMNVNWLPASAAFRGYLSLGLLICAGTCFVAAGIIGYIKSVKLEKYMETKGVK